ncbi:fibronectin type III domain-containing protein [Pseudomonas marginalis]|uniref:fibronectin type III domain-containing protein n=1 Tax=Pseudomonas fluorescens group TaxID=136843 RepID=UPI001F438EBD|nr:fibronectin type III domain-containing protein [Pseudomonas marginalis]MCF5667327.1 hypothetical protein [Pseudomonas marginalis]MCM2379771.1 fibronectin type III domain-containing protein [Pseudomonas marginalis]
MNDRIDVNAEITSATSAKITWDGSSDTQYHVSYSEIPHGEPVARTVKGNETHLTGLETGVRYGVTVTHGVRQGGTSFVPREVP